MKKGFTLAELLVSIAIITILSGIGMQTYFVAQRNARLSADVITVTSIIRQAQNRALSPSRSDLTGIAANEKLCAMGVNIVPPDTLQPFYKVEGSTGACDDDRNYGNAIVLSSAEISPSGLLEFRLPFANNESTVDTIQLQLPGLGAVFKTITLTDAGLINVE